MKIVIAPDSFKGTLTAYEAALTIAEAFTGAADEIIQLPVADGGESTLSCFRSAIGGNYVDVNVANPYMERITAKYLLSGDTAVVEVAEAAGLTLVEGRKNVRLTTSYGVGELIKAALDAGAKKIYVAVGGSATNDGGAGLAAALGVKFTDAEGLPMLPTGGTLGEIERIDVSELDKRISEVKFTALCDVHVPLLGKDGAVYVFAPQKGASVEDLELLESGMASYAALLSHTTGKEIASLAGGGAGGGIGAGLSAFLNAELIPGAGAVLKAMHFEEALSGATAVITGEGRLDRQSFMGKVVGTVADIAKGARVKTYCLAGDISSEITDSLLAEHGIELAIRCASETDFIKLRLSAQTDLYKAACGLREYLKS